MPRVVWWNCQCNNSVLCLVSACLLQDAVSELKERARAQYQKMHALLEANQTETMHMLENTYIKYVRKNSQQVLQLNERRQEAEKLLSSAQTLFQKAESMNFMKVEISTSLSIFPMGICLCECFTIFASAESNFIAMCKEKKLNAHNVQTSFAWTFLCSPVAVSEIFDGRFWDWITHASNCLLQNTKPYQLLMDR